MTPQESEKFHQPQIELLAEDPRIDMIDAITICDAHEAVGMVWAAKKAKVPISVLFMPRKDGCKLQSGHTIKVTIQDSLFRSLRDIVVVLLLWLCSGSN